jgi:TatD DNase family protein
MNRVSESRYCDVHTHLTHDRFREDQAEVIARAVDAGLGAIVCNGLNPPSNREILSLSASIPEIKPALGIYPTDAVNEMLPADYPWRVDRFDVDLEIEFIRQCASRQEIVAIGECGLDGHLVGPETFAAQEKVFEALVAIAIEHDLPVIVHSRKREVRCAEILAAAGASKVDFHCFGGKTKHAQKWAEERGWYFSIPANARVSESFRKMLSSLPIDRILTETDAPYMGPVRGERNEPANVVGTVAFLAELRGWTPDEAKNRIWKNYCTLFEA